MFNIFKKNEKPQSKLANFKGLDLNEAELKKVMGGGGGSNTTTTTDPTGGTGSDPSDSNYKRKNGALSSADFGN